MQIFRARHAGLLAWMMVSSACAAKPVSSARPLAHGEGGTAAAVTAGSAAGTPPDNPGEPPEQPSMPISQGAAGSATGAVMTVMPSAKDVLKDNCASATVQAELLPANMLFVLDRSGSMNCNLPPITGSEACERTPSRADRSQPSKWEITQAALVGALQKLPKNVSVGISYFSNDDGCGVSSTPSVPVAALDDAQLSAVQVSLENVRPSGGTPLVGATILAYKHLHALALGHKLTGNNFVVLLTDGQQSDQCSDPDVCSDAQQCTQLLTEREVPKAASPGADIRTFVIGAPGSEPARAVLSAIALKGATAPAGCDAAAGECHFDMTRQADFAAALTRALTAITSKAVTCELPVPSPQGGTPLDRTRVNVVYTKGDGSATQVVPQDTRTACDSAQGWQYSSDSTKIVLCGTICERVRNDSAARLDVVLGCPVQEPS